MINKKTVLITGCSEGGIGAGLALAFQSRGLHVFATARTVSKMSSLSSRPNMSVLALDITSPKSIQEVVETVSKQTGGTLDYLVNNAGALTAMPVLDMDLEEGRKLFEVNFWGQIAVTQAFAPLLVRAKGTVVNNSSVVALISSPSLGAYSASKAAQKSLSDILRLELAPLNVTVLTLMTGGVYTNIFTNVQSNDSDSPVPESSYYRPIEAQIRKRQTGEDRPNGMHKVEDYADKVVGDVLARRSARFGNIYRGMGADLCRFLPSLLPVFLVDRLMLRGTGFDTFKLTD